ncbi:MAG: glycoside hydrolase family 65 protein [Acidimicrobiia bacterium]|nr:glycoside hydrolase family 65 protein [Acidimicrobiia bacterium]MDH5290529.1 glycoside hydrolase family 65 protein [Acidimicrobiia bacterium]
MVHRGSGAADAFARQPAARPVAALPAPERELGWVVERHGFDPDRLRVNGAVFTVADGRIGTSGAALASHPELRRWVLAGGVYTGSGPETRLLGGPVAAQLPFAMAPEPGLHRVLDLRSGLLWEEVLTTVGPLTSVRFASLAQPGTLVLRARLPGPCPAGPRLLGPDDETEVTGGEAGDAVWKAVAATGDGATGGIVAAAADVDHGDTLDRIVVYRADPDLRPDQAEAVAAVRAASGAGFEQLLAGHRRAWARRWRDADIVIEGDDELQLAVRFSLFHLMASVGDGGEAAVGARGLSGPGYRGHVFWDADTFMLPFLAATHPEAARAMIAYRLNRLPAALEAARRLGRVGARFPWESAGSGRDVTPLSARNRTGQLVPIRTGQLEEHIVAEVAWAATCYSEWTGDEAFAAGPGRDLLVHTARYWASRIRFDEEGLGHIYGVIGPDEYHEPVDDNAFTNLMARWNLRRAASAVDAYGWAAAGPGAPGGGRGEDGEAEVQRWRAMAEALVDGYDPDTAIYEQFAGFHELEPLLISEVAPRRPIAADLLLGAERVSQAQVLKQADVLMAHHLLPEEVEPGSLEPNLRYYEPRTAHGSSLSPGVHASLLARARNYEPALEALRLAARMDLDDLTGTTAGGLHLATMGSLWQALAFGFAGLRPRRGRLGIDPRLPPSWGSLEIRVRFRGHRLVVAVGHDWLQLTAEGPTPVEVDDVAYEIGSRTVELTRRGRHWRVDR